MTDRRDEIVETGSALQDANSEASRMVQRYQQAIREAQEAQLRNETGPDCE